MTDAPWSWPGVTTTLDSITCWCSFIRSKVTCYLSLPNLAATCSPSLASSNQSLGQRARLLPRRRRHLPYYRSTSVFVRARTHLLSDHCQRKHFLYNETLNFSPCFSSLLIFNLGAWIPSCNLLCLDMAKKMELRLLNTNKSFFFSS